MEKPIDLLTIKNRLEEGKLNTADLKALMDIEVAVESSSALSRGIMVE